MSHHNSQRPLLLPRDAYDAHNAAADHCKIFAKSLALDAECLAASKNYDAARAWSLLGSRAQNILKALCAAGDAPAVSAGSSEPAASRARTASGLARCPEDVLGAIIAFVDLPMRFTCVVASRTLRDACARMSPRLEHELVLKRFPLLTGLPVTGSSLAGVPAPKDLFRMYRDKFNGESFRAQEPEATIPLDAYTMTLELISLDNSSVAPGLKSVYVGSRAISLLNTGTPYTGPPFYGAGFTIPEGLFERALDQPHLRFSANVMVSRRSQTGRVQFARLYSGVIGEYDSIGFSFDTLISKGKPMTSPPDGRTISLTLITRRGPTSRSTHPCVSSSSRTTKCAPPTESARRALIEQSGSNVGFCVHCAAHTRRAAHPSRAGSQLEL